MTLGLTIGIGVCAADKYLSPNKKLNGKTIAMYIQNEEGTYTESTETQFPTDGYVLNTEKSNCRNGGTITQDSSTKKIRLTASKTDSCTLYFDKVEVPTSEQTLTKLGLTSNGVKDSFDEPAKTDEGIFEMEDDYGTSYYYRGAVENNYVKFGKNKSGQDMFWRIVRINGDGSLRIIYDGTSAHANGESSTDRVTITNVFWNEKNVDDPKYIGYMYGGANGVASTSKEQAQTNETDTNIKVQLEKWYKENILNTGYEDGVNDVLFCNDRSTPDENYNIGFGKNQTHYGAYVRIGEERGTPIPSFKCLNQNDSFTTEDTIIGNGKLTYPIGLITADEAVAAGSGYFNNENKLYYLYKGNSYWTFTPRRFGNAGWTSMLFVISNSLYNSFVYSVDGWPNPNPSVVPVINLSPEYVQTMVGTGTMTDPYRVEA